jgi:hypothetical protein
MIRMHYDPDEQILKTTFNGIINANEIRDYMLSVNTDPELPEVLNILIDAVKAELHIAPEEIETLAVFNTSLKPRFLSINNAIITQKPNNTAFMQVYGSLSKSRHYRFKIFQIRENALNWLKNISYSD